ncbi:MAG TPA: DUF1015 family protein [Verrucomicrobiota bacterium]|nr:DUF1015 family protein [Verrucomicrobiota bacterium]HNU50863.1 DUF1015 family protein [Verrucomicrobiota bacterium]
MAVIQPFAAWRPRADLAARISELPYDVLSSEEARAAARDNPHSFFHVSKAEIDLPDGTDPHAPEVYALAKDNYDAFRTQGILVRQTTPVFYLYRQIMGAHAQTGIVALASCREYLDGTIRRHELTRPDKEDDRTRHIETLSAQTGPAFLIYRAQPSLRQWIRTACQQTPDSDFGAPDGVRHTTWTVAEPAAIAALSDAVRTIPRLYIADGHHRTAAAARVFQARAGAGSSAWFLAVLFAHDELQILPYHRVLEDLGPHTPDTLRDQLAPIFEFLTAPTPQPQARREINLYCNGRWSRLRFRSHLTQPASPADQLDVALLQHHVLGPVFGIHDPRTSKRLRFVGGVRDTAELERLVNARGTGCAFALAPTRIEDLLAIADAGGIMPPKSTWFEPKLRDALFSHDLND